MIKDMGMESCNGQMAGCMKDIFSKESSMGKENSKIKQEIGSKVFG